MQLVTCKQDLLKIPIGQGDVLVLVEGDRLLLSDSKDGLGKQVVLRVNGSVPTRAFKIHRKYFTTGSQDVR